jgi:hypothetical protein
MHCRASNFKAEVCLEKMPRWASYYCPNSSYPTRHELHFFTIKYEAFLGLLQEVGFSAEIVNQFTALKNMETQLS